MCWKGKVKKWMSWSTFPFTSIAYCCLFTCMYSNILKAYISFNSSLIWFSFRYYYSTSVCQPWASDGWMDGCHTIKFGKDEMQRSRGKKRRQTTAILRLVLYYLCLSLAVTLLTCGCVLRECCVGVVNFCVFSF